MGQKHDWKGIPPIRLLNLWHRRAGKDDFSINAAAVLSQLRVGNIYHVLPTYQQGRKIVWEGKRRDGTPFLNAFPDFDNPGPKKFVTRKRDDDMTIWLHNGSMYQVLGSDKIDSLVGTNPVLLIMSEFALQDPQAWMYLEPILMENGGIAIFPYTPRGRNHGFDLWEEGEASPHWFNQRLTIEDTKYEDGTPLVPQERFNELKKTRPLEILMQEYYCSFDVGLEGAYYKREMQLAHDQKRICSVPYQAEVLVDTHWDIGYDDSTSIIFSQRVGREIHIIDYYENSGEGVAHYASVLNQKGYNYGSHYGPHDIVAHEKGSGKSYKRQAAEVGIRFKVTKKTSIVSGINNARSVMSRVWFDDTRPETKRLVRALKEYTKKWNETMKTWSEQPLHDWTSHPADAFRYLCMNYRDKGTSLMGERAQFALTDDDPFNPGQAQPQRYRGRGRPNQAPIFGISDDY